MKGQVTQNMLYTLFHAHRLQMSENIQLWTAPFDSRFPNQNQTKNCWQNYVDYHRCTRIKGEDYEPCEYFKRVYKSLCPSAWVSCEHLKLPVAALIQRLFVLCS